MNSRVSVDDLGTTNIDAVQILDNPEDCNGGNAQAKQTMEFDTTECGTTENLDERQGLEKLSTDESGIQCPETQDLFVASDEVKSKLTLIKGIYEKPSMDEIDANAVIPEKVNESIYPKYNVKQHETLAKHPNNHGPVMALRSSKTLRAKEPADP